MSSGSDLDDLFVAALAREMMELPAVFTGANQYEVALAAYLARRLGARGLGLWASAAAQIDPAQDGLMVGRRSYDNVSVAARGATFWQARAFDDTLRAPAVFAGGLQVDGQGNANLAGVTGEDGGWKVRGPGSAGLPSLTAFARRFYLIVADHQPRFLVERCARLSVIGAPAARAAAGLAPDALSAVITPLARFAPSADGLVLVELAPGVGAEEVARRTGFEVRAAETVAERPPLTAAEARALAALRDSTRVNRGA